MKEKGSLHFVVQYHIATRVHFDFRLEYNGVLLSFAVPKGPSLNPQDKRLAVMVEDHPIKYRNFEGTIPKGNYGAGTVIIWDEGYYMPLADFDKGLNDGSLKFILSGKRLQGSFALIKIKNAANKNKNNWLLIKENDIYAKSDSGISDFITSVRTNRTVQHISGKEL